MSPTQSIREPAVAGTFYPNDPSTLSSMIDGYLAEAPISAADSPPKAVIAPHAGYVYSGPIAAQVYRDIDAARIRRVVLLGPSHRVAFRGMAVPTSTVFRTPLGDVDIDSAAINDILGLPNVGFLDEAHTQEHSLEVHLPFLQQLLPSFTLVPIVLGDVSKEDVASVLEKLWGGPETLIVISSDLSHYEPYEKAREMDRHTCNKIVALEPTLHGNEACGCRGVNGLLHYLKAHNLNIETVDLRNSGDTAGDRSRVVGYGAWRVLQDESTMKTENREEWSLAERQMLLQTAREAIRSPLDGEKNYHIDLNKFPASLRQERASFVTINLNGNLRGCIGSLTAHRPLILDVAHNAQAAAFQDPRFASLTHQEYQQIDLHISILSEPEEQEVSSREDLLQKLQPGVHGLIIKENGRQATYLPSVWEQLPDPDQFVRELRRKAGLTPDGWDDRTQVFFYTTEEFS